MHLSDFDYDEIAYHVTTSDIWPERRVVVAHLILNREPLHAVMFYQGRDEELSDLLTRAVRNMQPDLD